MFNLHLYANDHFVYAFDPMVDQALPELQAAFLVLQKNFITLKLALQVKLSIYCLHLHHLADTRLTVVST